MLTFTKQLFSLNTIQFPKTQSSTYLKAQTFYNPPSNAANLQLRTSRIHTQKPLYLQSDIREFHLQVLANANRLEIRR